MGHGPFPRGPMRVLGENVERSVRVMLFTEP